MVMPVGRSLVFSGSQAKIVRTLPITGKTYFVLYRSQEPLPPGTWPKASDEADGNTGRPQPGFFRITGKFFFALHRHFRPKLPQIPRQCVRRLDQLPLPRKSLKRGKDILVSTSRWEVANHIRYGIRFTVRILGGITHYLSLIPRW
jgi:hypothetical protein